MSAWMLAGCMCMIALVAPAWRCSRGGTNDRLIGLMFAGELATLVLLALAVAFERSFYVDCALAVAILPYPSALVFAHFYEKWL